MLQRKRGLVRPHRKIHERILAARRPFHAIRDPNVIPPTTFAVICMALSYWLNQLDGDCVSAEACASQDAAGVLINPANLVANTSSAVVYAGAGLVISDAAISAFVRKWGYANGADLDTVCKTMQSSGITDGTKLYREGPDAAVDYTNYSEVCAAIFQTKGPLKIAVAANQFESAYDAAGNAAFVPCFGFRSDQATDHCINWGGFGTAGALFDAFNSAHGSTEKSPVSQDTLCYHGFTWDRQFIGDVEGLASVTDEGLIRTPTAIVSSAPAPAPSPEPSPAPRLPPTRRGLAIANALAHYHSHQPKRVEQFLETIEAHSVVRDAMASFNQ